MKKIIFMGVMVAAMFIVNNAEAQQRNTPGINNQQRNQHSRIKQGVRSGEVTKQESRHLRMQQAKIRNYKQMAKADGRVNRRERNLIASAQCKANNHIYRAKHNDRRY